MPRISKWPWGSRRDLCCRMAGARTIHVPDPSWGNHGHIFRSAGFEVQNYAYLDHRTGTTLDFDGARALREARTASSSARTPLRRHP